MKKISFLMMFLVTSMAFCLTSCLGDDDDDNKLTTEQMAAATRQMSGRYTGTMGVFVANTDRNQLDSIAKMTATWSLQDSTITLKDFPVGTLANAVDTVNNKGLRSALQSARKQTVTCTYGYLLNQSDFGNPYYLFASYPTKIAINNLSWNGKTHQVTVYLTGNSYYSSYYDLTKMTMVLNLVSAGIFVDNATTNVANKQMWYLLQSATKF